jgi:VTC domain
VNQPLASPSLWNPTASESQSPSREAKLGAYEIKFLVDETLVNKLIPVVQTKMKPDSFADPKTGSYSVEGIYYETSDLSVFNKTPGYSRKKFRIRRYSEGATLFLERKSKRKGIVTKRRIQLDADQLPKMLQTIPTSETAASPSSKPSGQTELDWFARRLKRLMLRPTLCIAYDRVAFLQMDQLGPIRLTIDRSVGCCRLNQLGFPDRSSYQRILDGKCIVELKYREALPNTFRQFIEDFELKVQPVSKFRHAILATGLALTQGCTDSEGNEAC